MQEKDATMSNDNSSNRNNNEDESTCNMNDGKGTERVGEMVNRDKEQFLQRRSRPFLLRSVRNYIVSLILTRPQR